MQGMGFRIFIFIVGISLFGACKTDNSYKEKLNNADYLHRSMKQLSDVIVHDIFSPPVASRLYVYPSIAAYEIMRQEDSNYKTLTGQLRDMPIIPEADTSKNISLAVASTKAFLVISKALIFSEEKIDAFEMDLIKEIKSTGIPRSALAESLQYGESVAKIILDWADKDNYKQTRTFPKYSITKDEEKWKPTPPAYMDGIEPHWKKIRPMVLKSADQFVPLPPTEFDLTKGSKFYQELMEVYETVKRENKEEKAIAAFWDCNPYVAHQKGHVMFATKKITPGGHWVGITAIACRQDSASYLESAHAYAMTTISLFDAFISCWDEKYRSNLIRPETVINEHIDPDWKPTLQTPPFPEHTSGHSVISTAAALTLTKIFGSNFKFKDTVEVEYGLPARNFDSFLEASAEAAVSRLYGGIHYMPAIEYGVEQGKQVATYILDNVSVN